MIRRSTWVLFGISILLIASAVLWNRSRRAQENVPEPTSALEFLFEAPEERITGFTISSAENVEVELRKDIDGTWLLIKPESDTVDADRIESALLELGAFRVISRINSQLGKDLIGLDPPQYSMLVELDEGDPIQVFIGNATPTPGGYYAYVEGQPVVVVNSFSVENVIDLIDNPPILTTPTPTSSS